MTSARVRPATTADHAAVLRMLGEANLPVADIQVPGSARFWVAEVGDAVVGAIGLEHYGGHGLLRSLVVSTDYRKQGIGALLVRALEQEARALGVVDIFLLTQTAERFFGQRGYATVSRESAPGVLRQSAEFRSLCPASAVCMRKSLHDR